MGWKRALRINDKIKVNDIISNHISTIYSIRPHEPKYVSRNDHIYFWVLPVIFSLIMGYFVPIEKDYASILIPFFAIFGGFIFNMNVFLLRELDNIVEKKHKMGVRIELSKELYYNINFTVLLVLFLIILLFTNIVLLNFKANVIVRCVFSGISYFALTQFLISLLMILNRIYKLFDEKFDRIKKEKEKTFSEEEEEDIPA